MINLSAAMPESVGENLMILGHRHPFEYMILRVLQRGFTRIQPHPIGVRLVTQPAQQTGFLWCKPRPLPGMDFLRGDLNQFVGPGFPDENGYLIVGRLAAESRNKPANGFVALPASLAVFSEKIICYPANLKSAIAAP
jgi:hypothetical protein